eukprot:125465_1
MQYSLTDNLKKKRASPFNITGSKSDNTLLNISHNNLFFNRSVCVSIIRNVRKTTSNVPNSHIVSAKNKLPPAFLASSTTIKSLHAAKFFKITVLPVLPFTFLFNFFS